MNLHTIYMSMYIYENLHMDVKSNYELLLSLTLFDILSSNHTVYIFNNVSLYTTISCFDESLNQKISFSFSLVSKNSPVATKMRHTVFTT